MNLITKLSLRYIIAMGIVISLSGAYCIGQSMADKMRFKRLNIQDGLVSSMITDMVEDHRGVLWISTYSGLSQFDGTEFINYSASIASCGLANDHLLELKLGPDGNIYMITKLGWSIFNITEQCFYNYELKPKFKGVVSQNVWSVHPDKNGIVWLGIHNGLAKFDLNEETYEYFITPSNSLLGVQNGETIREVQADYSDTNTLVLALRGGLCYFSKEEEVFQFTIPPAIWPYRSTADSRSLHILNDSVYWNGSWGNGMGHYDSRKKEWSFILTEPGMQYTDLNGKITPWELAIGVMQYDENHVWIGFQRGLGILSQDENILELVQHNPNDPTSISHDEVVSIIRTRSGVIYLGTTNGISIYDSPHQKMNRFDPKKQKTDITEAWYESNSIQDLMLYCARIPIDDQHLLYSDAILGGISILDITSMTTEHIDVNLYNGKSTIFYDAVQLENNDILLGSHLELFIFNPENQELELFPGSLNDTLKRIRINRPKLKKNLKGDLFIWDERNIVHVFPDGRISTIHSNFLFRGVEINELIVCPDGSVVIWIDNRAYKLSKGNLIPLWMSNIPVSAVRAGVCIADTFWIGTHSSGIYKYVLAEDSLALVYLYSAEDGLPSNNVSCLSYDNRMSIWGSTHNGIFELNLSTDHVRSYDLRDGIELAYVDEPIVFFPGGRVVFDDRRYIYNFQPEIGNEFDGMSYIKSLEFRDSTYVDLTYPISLAPNDNTVTIKMGIIDHINGTRDKLFYWLDGFDDSWQRSGKDRSARYTNLHPGDYRLRVRARNPDGNYSETVYAAFTIRPALYQQVWFLPGLLFLIIIGMYMVFKLRERNLKRAEYERTQHNIKIAELELKALRSQMNPHFMFNSLNSIKNYIQKAEPQKASEYLSNFAHLIRLTLQHSREKNVTLENELEALLLYVDLEKLRFRNGFEFNCTVDETIDLAAVAIPPMILQPYVENAIWHGLLHKDGERRLSVCFNRSNGMLQCSIEDNGIGREKAMDIKSKSATRYKSMGMGIIKDRLDILNQMNQLGIELEIIDKLDADDLPAGTRVNIKIPYESNPH